MVLYLTEGLITESVSSLKVTKAIKDREAILITYNDETKTSHEGVRYIEPYVFGTTKAGNLCIRAYQYWGDTKRGVPKWKMFRLDRILSWEPTGEVFELEPKARGWAAEAYNNNGDGSMSSVYMTVNLSDEPLTDYQKMKAKTKQLQNGKRFNISQIQNQNKPQTTNTANNQPVETPNVVNKQKEVQYNEPVKQDTQQEPQNTLNGPVSSTNDNSTNTQNNPSAVDNKNEKNPINPVPMNDDDFKKMIQRNLEITQKEKERRFGNRQK